MKYLQVKSSSQKNKSESYVFIKSDSGVTKLPDNWTLEFFLNSKISTSNTEDLSIFDLKLKETSTSEISSAIQIYVSALESNNYIFKIGEKTKILSESNLFRLWDHIAIVWAKDCSIIIYVNSNPILGINMSEVSFKDYNKFDKFLFTTYKGTNIVCFAGIKVYESIKYNKNGFLINYPTSSNTTIIPNSGNGHSIDFINNTSDEDKNILVVNDPEIIAQITENINTEIFRMNFNDIDNVLSEEYKNYINIQTGSTFSPNSIEMKELDDEIVYNLYDVSYRFSQMLRIKSDFIFSFNTDLGNIAANTGVSIDLLARHTNQTSSSDFVKCYNANSSGQLASIKENGTGINVISSSDETTVSISNNASTLLTSRKVSFVRKIDNNKIIHYLQNIKCSSAYSYNNIAYKYKINGVDFYNYSNNINTIHKPNYYSIRLNSGSKTVTIFVLLKAGDYIKLFRISKNNLFGSFDPSFYLFGPMVVNNTAIENKDNDKTNSLQNIQLLYPTPNSTNIYERSHSDDETHINKYYFIMEATSTTDINFTTQFTGAGCPSEYASYPAIITTSNTRERNLIKFRCPYPVYSNWTFECWIYLKQNNIESDLDASATYYDLLYLSGLQQGYIGLKISPRLGNIIMCYDKKNIYSSNINTMLPLQTTGNNNYYEIIKMKDSVGVKLNEWNHIAIACKIDSSSYNYNSTAGSVQVYVNGSASNIESINSFNLAYLHRIFLFTKSLNSYLIPIYTGIKVTYKTAKTLFNTTLTV